MADRRGWVPRVGERVARRGTGRRPFGTILRVTEHAHVDSAGSLYQVRVRWDAHNRQRPKEAGRMHSGAQLEPVTQMEGAVYYCEKAIREELAKSGHAGRYDPRHIEAWMRLEHGTLDGLSASEFAAEVEIARQCVDADPSGSASLAQSYGL